MLVNSLSKIATEDHIDVKVFAEELSGKPLSDIAFFIKEGARLAAKSGKDKLDNESLEKALELVLSSDTAKKSNRMGFL